MNPNDIIGWIGAFCFAICSIPQVVQCFKTGHANGLSGGTLALWFTGEVTTVIYLFGANLASSQLLFNYGLNFIGLLIIGYFKCRTFFHKQPS